MVMGWGSSVRLYVVWELGVCFMVVGVMVGGGCCVCFFFFKQKTAYEIHR